MRNVKLEICVDSVDAAIHAMAGGANRIEICDRLDNGGLSPSMDLVTDIAVERHKLGLENHVALFAMVRPDDGGTYMYTSDEKVQMMSDLHIYASCGVLSGVVFGILQRVEENNSTTFEIDAKCVKEFAFRARQLGLDVTFHRAFDRVTDKYSALRFLADECGISRVLTSGNADIAVESVDLLRSLVKFSQHDLSGRISIMPGSGITPENAEYIVKKTGATEIHGSFQGCYRKIKAVKSIMQNL